MDAYSKRWRLANPHRDAYIKQRSGAKGRGVEFEISFEEWVEWWGEDFELRGFSKGGLQMCRYGDEGAYELGNIYKATGKENNAMTRVKDCHGNEIDAPRPGPHYRRKK